MLESFLRYVDRKHISGFSLAISYRVGKSEMCNWYSKKMKSSVRKRSRAGKGREQTKRHAQIMSSRVMIARGTTWPDIICVRLDVQRMRVLAQVVTGRLFLHFHVQKFKEGSEGKKKNEYLWKVREKGGFKGNRKDRIEWKKEEF